MAKQAKAKPTKGTTNDLRSNKKAFKKNTVKHRGVCLNETQKVLLGDGMFVNVAKRWAQNA